MKKRNKKKKRKEKKRKEKKGKTFLDFFFLLDIMIALVVHCYHTLLWQVCHIKWIDVDEGFTLYLMVI